MKQSSWTLEKFHINWQSDPALFSLIKSMMSLEAKDRPTAKEVVQKLEAIQEGGFEKLLDLCVCVCVCVCACVRACVRA